MIVSVILCVLLTYIAFRINILFGILVGVSSIVAFASGKVRQGPNVIMVIVIAGFLGASIMNNSFLNVLTLNTIPDKIIMLITIATLILFLYLSAKPHR